MSTSTISLCKSSTQESVNVNTSLCSNTDQDISIDREVFMKRKVSKVVFGSEDIRYKNKDGRHDVEIVSVNTEEEGKDFTSDNQVYQIPSVESSAKLPVRNKETDVLVKRCVLHCFNDLGTFSVFVELEMSYGHHQTSHQIS